MDYAAICNACPVVADCKVAFGKYWLDKSRGGKGCGYPFPGWRKGVQVLPTMPKRPTRSVMQGEMILRPTRPRTKTKGYNHE